MGLCVLLHVNEYVRVDLVNLRSCAREHKEESIRLDLRSLIRICAVNARAKHADVRTVDTGQNTDQSSEMLII